MMVDFLHFYFVFVIFEFMYKKFQCDFFLQIVNNLKIKSKFYLIAIGIIAI